MADELELTTQERALVQAALNVDDKEAASLLMLAAAIRQVEADPLTVVIEIDGQKFYATTTAPCSLEPGEIE